MIRQDIDIEGYWSIVVVYDVYLGQDNSGFTYTNYEKRLSIVVGSRDASIIDIKYKDVSKPCSYELAF